MTAFSIIIVNIFNIHVLSSLLSFFELEMYTTAGYIIQHLTNRSFPEFITDNIIAPLGMSSSSYLFEEAVKSGIVADGFVGTATGDPDGEGKRRIVYMPVPYFDQEGETSNIAPAGGVISNAKDMVRRYLLIFFYLQSIN